MADVIKTVVLGVFALVAMGLVVVTALKGSRKQALPRVEELVGVPPALDTEQAVVGEATATEAELMGMELSEEQIMHQHLLSQISELVRSSPDEAAGLVGRWVTEEV